MIKTNLHRILGERRMSQKKLATLSGLSTATVHVVFHDSWKQIQRGTMEKICSALNVDISELFEMTDDD